MHCCLEPATIPVSLPSSRPSPLSTFNLQCLRIFSQSSCALSPCLRAIVKLSAQVTTNPPSNRYRQILLSLSTLRLPIIEHRTASAVCPLQRIRDLRDTSTVLIAVVPKTAQRHRPSTALDLSKVTSGQYSKTGNGVGWKFVRIMNQEVSLIQAVPLCH